MNDYPYSDKSFDMPWQRQQSEPLGRIRVLEDNNGDGIYDSSTVFAENLSWHSGLALWKGGVYVAATPDVLYLKHTDGDRKADVRRRVFTGFPQVQCPGRHEQSEVWAGPTDLRRRIKQRWICLCRRRIVERYDAAQRLSI